MSTTTQIYLTQDQINTFSNIRWEGKLIDNSLLLPGVPYTRFSVFGADSRIEKNGELLWLYDFSEEAFEKALHHFIARNYSEYIGSSNPIQNPGDWNASAKIALRKIQKAIAQFAKKQA